jgi:hypothetical protein
MVDVQVALGHFELGYLSGIGHRRLTPHRGTVHVKKMLITTRALRIDRIIRSMFILLFGA